MQDCDTGALPKNAGGLIPPYWYSAPKYEGQPGAIKVRVAASMASTVKAFESGRRDFMWSFQVSRSGSG